MTNDTQWTRERAERLLDNALANVAAVEGWLRETPKHRNAQQWQRMLPSARALVIDAREQLELIEAQERAERRREQTA